MLNETLWVFVSFSTCGHAQSVYADALFPDGKLDENILGDLRAGLSIKRITVAEFHELHSQHFLCDCKSVGHENESARNWNSHAR
jgi:hypothetical protein